MNLSKYTIGVDFGTLSCRALLVDTADGREVATSVYEYPHGVMDTALPSGKPLGQDWALEHPRDYYEGLIHVLSDVVKNGGATPEEIIAVGVDFTTCTVIPVKEDSTPLCFLPEFEDHPHAYVKLWKHHAAEPEATALTQIAKEMKEKWLPLYGGKVSSEFMIPKIWETLNDAEEVYNATDLFMDALDWIDWKLTGRFTRAQSLISFKIMWTPEDGYPSREYFKALDPRMENIVETKLRGDIAPLGACLGQITPEIAAATGLSPQTVVVTGAGDGHAAPLAMKAVRPGNTTAILGTSGVYIAVNKELHQVPGVFGIARDCLAPGYYAYEAGQACMGDHYAWFVKNCVPASYYEEAEARGMSIHNLMNEKAAALRPGESGLVALDWWNGNRSVLSDSELSGMILGMTLSTRPEEIYRALIEATAFGARKIIDTMTQSGVPTEALYATGGICNKSPFVMQTFADIIGVPIRLAGSQNGCCLGSAILAAVGAGSARGGYDDFFQAVDQMSNLRDTTYLPKEENRAVFNELYEEYLALHDYFGKGGSRAMHRLKALRSRILAEKQEQE